MEFQFFHKIKFLAENTINYDVTFGVILSTVWGTLVLSPIHVIVFLFFVFLESNMALTKAESTNDDSSKKPVCITESGASPNAPCIFPFRYNGVIHNSCIWEDAQYTEHKPWCSTLVDKAGHHVRRQSKWGNCGPDCPISPDNRNETTTVTGKT